MNLSEKKPIVVAVCLIAIVVSLGSLLITQCGGGPKVDTARYAAASEALAEHVGEELPAGSSIVLIVMDPSIESPVFRAQIKGFDDAFAAYKDKITEAERVTIKLSDMDRGAGSGMPTKVYKQVIESHPNATAIVSLVGIPLLSDAEIDELPEQLPKMYALILYGVGVKRAFDEGLVNGAVLPRYDRAAEEGPEPKSAKEIFERYYQYVTDQNYENLTF